MKNKTTEDWHLLFSKIAQGDMSAYLVVYQAYYETIHSVAYQYCKLKHLADDATQQVFVELWERRDKLVSVENPEAWLWVIARNQTIKIIKKEMSHRAYVEYLKNYFSDEEMTPINQLIVKQRCSLIDRIINSLPARQLETYRLSREEGLTYQQIAKKLGIGIETVKEHIAKALKNIRTALKAHEHELRIVFIIFSQFFIF
ncbi:MAG: hypothetical protein DI598_08150 [Pseudopedobacter saltans]|uniref:RNA polymerase, sigma-24 subunit, ECF subfamily n=1 Tax=Pseudopedobacter saltans TaxID=151895 RepID=A0A2W5H670_9SPHI|nr:MAG: hypothetical protein DI598_08150 [Pseudopedobacter saltans]